MKVKRILSKEGEALKVALKNLENKQAKVGWFERSRYDDEENLPVAFVAEQNECGNPEKNIPARPFMAPTAHERKNEWREIARQGAKQVLKGRGTSADILELLGQQAVGDIKKTIMSIWSPALRPVTIANRLDRMSDKKTIGNIDKPLVDTGVMYNTIINIVEDV